MNSNSNLKLCPICKSLFEKYEVTEKEDVASEHETCSECTVNNEKTPLMEELEEILKKITYNDNNPCETSDAVTLTEDLSDYSITTIGSDVPFQYSKAYCYKFFSELTVKYQSSCELEKMPVIVTEFEERIAVKCKSKNVSCGAIYPVTRISVNRNDDSTDKSVEEYYKLRSNKPAVATTFPKPEVVLFASRFMDDDKRNTPFKDIMIFWVASNDYGSSFYYSLSILLTKTSVQRYCGLVQAFKDNPLDLYKERKCLRLNHKDVLIATEEEKIPMIFDIVFHNKRP